ncbi:YqhA family protein [bacterium]|nr:YqhA family protein [bacterium]
MENLNFALAVTLCCAAGLLVLVPLTIGLVSELKPKGNESPPQEPLEPTSLVAPATRRHHDFGSLLLFSRWLLVPFYVGLVATVGLYLYKFLLKLYVLFGELGSLSDKEIMLRVLYLVDIVMVANLLMYTAVGSFAYFVRGFAFTDEQTQPGMLGHLDATTLKMKLGMALIGVSSIHLLEVFMDSAHVSIKEMISLVVVHLVFVFSTLAIAWIRTMPSAHHPVHHEIMRKH